MSGKSDNRFALALTLIIVLFFVFKGCSNSFQVDFSGKETTMPWNIFRDLTMSPTDYPGQIADVDGPEKGYAGPSSDSEIVELDYNFTNEFGAIPVSIYKSDVYLNTTKVKPIELTYHLSKYENTYVHIYDCGAYLSTWSTVKDLLYDAGYSYTLGENYPPLSHLWEF